MKFIQPFFILLLLANGLQAQNCSTFDISAASSASTILCGGNATLTASPTNSQSLTVSYSWSPGGSTQPSLVVSPKTNTTYTVLATRSDGCTKSKTVSVAVTPFDIT
ncbi:MAG: hypothetical protein EAZ07_03530 [Cytophagales bacterium]|nr:MAG: hypothetical protein EAZ07_03530 [Cytophagales bacterium]